MKKLIIFLCTLLFLCSFNNSYMKVQASDDLLLNTSSCVLMEADSKNVIYSKNPHQKLYPASMTKMMGLYLILEGIQDGVINWDDQVCVSKKAASMGGTQIYLEENEVMKLEDLFKAVAINSANDAIVALGEHLCLTNEAFIDKMNQKAKQFNMNDTHFNNATGFDDDNHYSSPYDMALLGCHLVSFGDDILRYTSLKEAYIREDTSSPFWLVNTNKLLGHYDGIDGLKTGFTNKAGYNLTSSAKRGNIRLVSTVMNLDTIAHRSQDTIRLLDYGFSRLKSISLFDRNDVVSKYEFSSLVGATLEVYVKENIDVILFKEEDEKLISINCVLDNDNPPYKKDEKVGILKIITPSSITYEYDIYAYNDVNKVSFWTYFIYFIKLIFA